MLRLSVHPLADVTDIGEDTLLVSLPMNTRRCDRVSLARGSEESRVGSMKGGIEAGEEFGVEVVAIGGKPWLGAGIDTRRGLATAVEDIVPELSLVEVFEVFPVRDILPIFICLSVSAIGSF